MNDYNIFTAVIVGNLTADPELHVGKGKARVTFTIAINPPSRFDEQRQRWISDGGVVFQKVVAFGQRAHNVAASLHRGDAVVVHGRVKDNSYTATRGTEEFVIKDTELVAAHIGLELGGAIATITKNRRPDQGAARTATNV
jgi:single-strand DNA-binding protein